MEWTSLVVGLGVPIVSFGTGVLTTKLNQRDVRTSLAKDLELLASLPANSDGRRTLAESIDKRIIGLAERSSPAEGFWSWILPREARIFASAGLQFLVFFLLLCGIAYSIAIADGSASNWTSPENLATVKTVVLLAAGVPFVLAILAVMAWIAVTMAYWRQSQPDPIIPPDDASSGGQ